MIYGSNELSKRRELWYDIINLTWTIVGYKWIIFGDFNEVMYSFERVNQWFYNDFGPTIFCNAISIVNLQEMNCVGLTFIWSNRVVGANRKESKINVSSQMRHGEALCPNNIAIISRGTRDHYAQIVRFTLVDKPNMPFWLHNSWLKSTEHKELVCSTWGKAVTDSSTFRLTSKSKTLWSSTNGWARS